jgi:hypothetical protein
MLAIAAFPCIPRYAVLVGDDQLADMDTASNTIDETLRLAAEIYPGERVVMFDDPEHYSQPVAVAS